MTRLKQTIGLLLFAILGLAIGYSTEWISLKIILLAAIGLVGAVVLLLPYSWAIGALFLYLGVEGMAKLLTFYHPLVHVGADLLIAALCARTLFALLLRRTKWPDHRPPLFALFVMHWLWFTITLANPYALSLIASLAGAKMYVMTVILFFFGYYLTEGARQIRGWMWVWIAVLAIQCLTSLPQAAIGRDSVLALSPAYAGPLEKFKGYAFRPFGTTSQPGGPAVFLFLTMPFLVYFLLHAKRMLHRSVALVLLPLATLTLVLCQVRSAIFKAIVGTAIFLLLGLMRASGKAKVRTFAIIGAVAAVMLVALPALTGRWVDQNEENARAIQRSMSLFDVNVARGARKGAIDRIISYAEQVPLGAGLSRTGAASGKFADLIAKDPFFNRSFFTDNFWAATIVDLGIPGTIVMTVLIFGLLAHALRARSKMRDGELVALHGAIYGVLVACVIGLWGAEGLLYNPEAAFFWFFAGVMIKLPELERVTDRAVGKKSDASTAFLGRASGAEPEVWVPVTGCNKVYRPPERCS